MTADKTTGPDALRAPITMTYRNYRGEIAERCIIPDRVWFGSTDWHPEPGWLMTAFDTDKGALRDFALADCQFADLCASGQARARMVELADVLDQHITDNDLSPHRLLLGGAVYTGPAVDWAHCVLSELRDLLRKYAALTPAPQPEGQVRPATIAHVIADMMAAAGEPRPNGDILADVLCQVLPAALTTAPSAATPTTQEAVPTEDELDEAWKSGFNAGFGEAMLTAHPPRPSLSVAEAGGDLVRAMRLFWEADEAADECRAAGKDSEAARYDKMATGRWQSIPEKIDALDAALRALKGGEE